MVKSFVWGIVIGVFVATLLPLFAIQYWQGSGVPVVRRFEHSSPNTSEEGADSSIAQRLNLEIALADTDLSPNFGFKSLVLTIGGLEIGVAETPEKADNLGYWQPLAVEEQTIDLVKAAQKDQLVELSSSQLSTGTYHTIRITLAEVVGRTPAGKRVAIPLTAENRTIEVLLPFDWHLPQPVTQLIIDLDLNASLREDNDGYHFLPRVRQIIENDTIRPLS